MLGMRTPPKKAAPNSPTKKTVAPMRDLTQKSESQNPLIKDAEPTERLSPLLETGEKTFVVRRSIGEIEARARASPKKMTVPTVGPSRLKTRRPSSDASGSQEIGEQAPKSSVEVIVSPQKTKFPNRVAEARACLNKAKLHMGNSRNLRTDIKVGVTQAIDRLYQLVKEAEMAKGRVGPEPSPSKTGERGEVELEEKKEKEDELIKKMSEHIKRIDENNIKMERLRETIEKQQEVSSLEGATYASVAARCSWRHLPEQAVLHSVVVSSRDETETGEEVLDKIRKVINAKEEGIKIDRIKKAKDRKIIVGCQTEDERAKVKEMLKKAGNQLSVEEVKNKDPLLIFKSVLSYNSDEDILRALRNQNGKVFSSLEEKENRMEVRYRKKTKNPLTCHVVAKVSPAIWKRMLQAEAVHIDLQRVRVEDQSPLIQCSLCLAYGHGRRFCKENAEKCSHCGGLHMRTECADWLAHAPPSCINCTKAGMEKAEHNAFSNDCPVRRKWEALARSTVAYC